jgi:FkbM family methyltransferase
MKKAFLRTADDRKNYFLQDSHPITIRNKEFVLYTPNSFLDFFASWGEEIEPELLDWIDTLPFGSTFFDIGSSNGLFALYAHFSGMKVTAFEPDSLNYSILEINRYLNQASFDALNIAISERSHLGDLYINRFGFGMHNKILNEKSDREGIPEHTTEHIQKVIAVSLDTFLDLFSYHFPRFVKIDVDGAELSVLQGGSKLFSRVEQIFIELSETRSDYQETLLLLKNLGFNLRNRFPVRHHKGGHYDNLHNYIFMRR